MNGCSTSAFRLSLQTRRLRYCPLLGGLICLLATPVSSAIDGGPVGVHWPAGGSIKSWSFDIGGESVGDRVEYEPHATGGGFDSVSRRQRYVAGNLALSYRPTSALRFSAGATSRQITSKRDIYTLTSWDASADYRFRVRPDGISLSAASSVGTNRAGALEKNSYTNYDDLLITSARLNDSRDWHLQGNLIATKALRYSARVSAYLGAGRALSNFEGFSGSVTDADDCRYDVDASSSGASVRLAQPCKSVLSFSRTYASLASFENEFDFDTRADFINESNYGQLGFQWQRTTPRSVVGIGYHYQRFVRGRIDDRLRERDMEPILDNHSLSAWWAYRLQGGWSLNAGVEYSRHPMLNRLWLLYTAYTTDRFRTAAATLRLGFRYDFDLP